MVASTLSQHSSEGALSVRLLGVAVFVVGAITLAAWLGFDRDVVRWLLDHGGMPFNTALLFAVAGAASALPARHPFRPWLASGMGVGIALFALAVLSQDVFGTSSGIDQWAAYADDLDARNLNPGRMAPNTAIGLAAVGILLFSFERSSLRAAAVAIPVLVFLVLALATTGLAQHALGLDFLYSWFDRPRMSIHAALSFLALGVAFWLRWIKTPEYASVFSGREDRKLRLVEAGILVLCVFTAGVAGFGATLRQTQNALTRNLSIGLDADIARVHRAVASERGVLALLGSQEAVQYALEHPDDPQSIAGLARVVGTRYWYVELDLRNGVPPLTLGHRPNAALEVDFPAYPGSSLLFSGALAVKIAVETRSRTGVSGKLSAIVPLSEIESLLRQPHVLGVTAALNLCVDSGPEHLRCFPSRHETGVTVRSKIVRSTRVPMARAIAGERGVSPGAYDTRGVPVLAAYAPVPALGMGAVLKVGSSELYQPLVKQLLLGVPVLFVLVALGVALLGSQVTPLVRSIVAAERQASNVTRALARKEKQTRAILDGVSDGIVGLAEDSTILSLNPATLRLLGGTPEQLIGRRFTDFIVKRDSAVEVLRLCGRALGGEESEPLEPAAHVVPLELKRLDGSSVEADIAIDGIDGNQAFSVGVIRDTSRQRYVERMKDEFVATVSHELRTPLTAIRGALQLVMGGIGGPLQPSGNELLKIASGNLERLIQLVNDILDFEKIAAGKLQFAFRPRDLRGIVLETLNTMRAYASLHRVELRLEPGREPAHVLADGDRLNQALTNLLSNAVKHSPSGGVVRVALSREGDAFRVSVADDGKGIPDAFRAQIFQPFAQADQSASRKTGGTGLGLSITKSIVERHRGRIDYISRPGAGTTFFIDLPECRAPLEATARLSVAPGSLKARLPQILYLHEDAAKRSAVAGLLGDLAVVTAGELDSATLELPEDGPYDVVLLDVTREATLPSELVRAAKSVGNFVLVYTTNEDSLDDAVRGLADDVLVQSEAGELALRRHVEELLRTSGRFEKAVSVHAS